MKAKTEAPSALFRPALARAADRLAALQADPSHLAIPKGPPLVASCPTCHGRGYTEKFEEGHLNPRQLCPFCDATGRYATEPGVKILELLAAALEPRALVSADEIAQHNEADAIRYTQEIARRTERAQRQAAARELTARMSQASAALLAGEEVPAELAPLVAELVDAARAGELPEQQRPAATDRQPSDPTAREQQQITAWGADWDRRKACPVFIPPEGPESEWPEEARELHELWLQQQRDADRQPEPLAD